MLEKNNKDLNITSWLVYFAEEVFKAQKYTLELINFTLRKTEFYDRAKNLLNGRQSQVIKRIFKEGVDDFEGELSAENYIKIAVTSRATATRDLQDLVDKNLVRKIGALKTTHYYINYS